MMMNELSSKIAATGFVLLVAGTILGVIFAPLIIVACLGFFIWLGGLFSALLVHIWKGK